MPNSQPIKDHDQDLDHLNNGANKRARNASPNKNAGTKMEEEAINISQSWGMLIHNKWLIATITFISTTLAFVYGNTVMPMYESQATVIIASSADRFSGTDTDISTLLMSSYGVGVGSTIDNELQVLRSYMLAEELARRVETAASLYGIKNFPSLQKDYPKDSSIASLEVVAERIRAYQMILQTGKMGNVLNIGYSSPSPFEAKFIANLIVDVYAENSTKQTRLQAKAALDFLKSELNTVRANLTSKEELMRQFMNQSRIVALDAQTNELVSILARLENEKRVADVQLESIESGLSRYNEELEQMKPGAAAMFSSPLAPILQRYQVQLGELETERVLILSKNPTLREHPEKDVRYNYLLSQIEVIKEELSTKTKELFKDQGYSMISFLSQADGGMGAKFQGLRNRILELQVQKVQYTAQRDVLSAQIAIKMQAFNGLPDNMITQARLKRDLQINEQLFVTLSRQAAEMALWEQTQFGMARVIDYARLPVKPTEPRKKVITVIGFTLGFVISFLVIAFRTISKTEIDSVEKLRLKGYPIIAVIPDLEEFITKNFDGASTYDVTGIAVSTSLVTFLDSISPIAESYRRLQSNITYSRPDNPYRVILTTSSNKSEGKSTITANLAVTLAESGNRVVIVDCDFRRPQVHKVFGLKRSPGVLEKVFSDEPAINFVMETVVPNLWVLPAGNKPPNPAEINRSQRLIDLINELKKEFNYVLIDTPPYGIITDAAPLMKIVDGVVLVAKLNQTQNVELDHTIENLKRINANVIGTVMNAYDKRKTSGYYYSDYYYQYSYESYASYEKSET